MVLNAVANIFDFSYTFTFHVFPQPLPVVILGLDFITILAAALHALNSEILVQLLIVRVPGTIVSNK